MTRELHNAASYTGNTCPCCDLQLALCGQDPETALNSALASVNFYLQQQQLYFEFREAQLQKKINKVQEACKKKLQEVHTGYTAVSSKPPHCMPSQCSCPAPAIYITVPKAAFTGVCVNVVCAQHLTYWMTPPMFLFSKCAHNCCGVTSL